MSGWSWLSSDFSSLNNHINKNKGDKNYDRLTLRHRWQFLRPEALKEARQKFTAGEISQAELTHVENQEIDRLIQKEEELGLKAVTDGEFRRSWWHLDFLWGLNGVAKYDYQESYKFHGAKTRTDNAELAGKVIYNPNHPFFEAFQFVQKHAKNAEAKQTIPSPTMLLETIAQTTGHNFTTTNKLISMI